MGVPETPNTQGSPRLLTVPEITERYGISRQAIHTYRQRGVFPHPAPEQGSTRLRFREDEVDAFFVANPKRPGKRTDRVAAPEGEPMRTQLADELETSQVLNDSHVLAAEQALWEIAGLTGPNPEFLAAIRSYRRAVLVASASQEEPSDG